MFFWIFMLVMALLIPLSMVILGKIFEKSPLNKISFFVGYRTRQSMKSVEAWAFAQVYCGRLFFRFGLAALVISAAAMLFCLGKSDGVVGGFGTALVLAQFAPVFVSVAMTEKALRKMHLR